MRWRSVALSGALLTIGCGEGAPHPYPESARMQYEASCLADNALCTCTWAACQL
jgi:hypothetical protein